MGKKKYLQFDIKGLMWERDITATQLAKLLKVSYSTMQNIIHNRGEYVSRSLIERMVEYFDVPWQKIFRVEEDDR